MKLSLFTVVLTSLFSLNSKADALTDVRAKFEYSQRPLVAELSGKSWTCEGVTGLRNDIFSGTSLDDLRSELEIVHEIQSASPEVEIKVTMAWFGKRPLYLRYRNGETSLPVLAGTLAIVPVGVRFYEPLKQLIIEISTHPNAGGPKSITDTSYAAAGYLVCTPRL